MNLKASGEFDVKVAPVADEKFDGASMGRMSLDKQFRGDLAGTSKGEMLTAMTATKGSAGYVAVERFTGTLAGKSGSFMLQHTGTMTRGAPQLTVSVVPDSGTGQLAGLEGRMTIDLSGGKHAYTFEYRIN
ncbi:hypothetical protein BWI17_19815 [Betaproteobacteria bacterium GR16-43]|nr:hypothetical protein BWI17_19815 [Betaproteobacteria bacterium GR16-43]